MMDTLLRILSALSDSIVELFIILFGALSTFVSNQVIQYFKEKRQEHLAEKKKKEMDIINQVTDKVALEVDSLHPDVTYEEQRAIAIEKARVILEQKDIKISEEELSIEVEDGFSKLPNYYEEEIPVEDAEISEFEEIDEGVDQIVEEIEKPLKRSNRHIHNIKRPNGNIIIFIQNRE